MEKTRRSGRKQLARRMKTFDLSRFSPSIPLRFFSPPPLCTTSASLPPTPLIPLLPWIVPPANVEAAENDAKVVERHPKRVVPVVLHQTQAGAPATCPQR